MAEKVKKLLNDYPAARWAALVLIALAMFFGYMFVDVMSPLQSLVEKQRGWTPNIFGTYASAEYILNVCGFLIIAGVILDKLGVRFSGILSAGLMVFGAAIKFIGVSGWFQNTAFAGWLGSPFSRLTIAATYNLLYNATWMVRQGVGSVLCLGDLMEGELRDGLTFRPFSPALKSDVYLAWKKGVPPCPATQALIAQVRESTSLRIR